MGGVPKQRHTKGHRNQRRMHIFVKGPTLTKCPKCQKPVLPHTVCQNCGTYKGRELIDVISKLSKKERKQKEKEMKETEKKEKKELSAEALSKK
jgi:large subunit ribosomal protein L32